MAMPQRDDTIEAIKRRAVEKKAAVSVNSALLEFYWNLGKDISEKYATTRYYGSRAMRLIMEIAAALERYKIVMEGPDGVRLRKLNHIRTIRGTTAIEGNTLTEGQITAVLAGKRVAATRHEIDEVKGAHRAYAKIVRQLRDANLIKREGGKKFGRWIVA